jgi:hypothetical protein
VYPQAMASRVYPQLATEADLRIPGVGLQIGVEPGRIDVLTGFLKEVSSNPSGDRLRL